MLTSSHSITAGTIGMAVGNPVLAFLLGIVIHFLLDAIPHYDTTDKGKLTFRQWVFILFDLTLAIMIIFLLIRPEISWKNAFLWGAAGGILPDILDDIPLWKAQFRKTRVGKVVHSIHGGIQKWQPSVFPGIAIQVFFVILFTAIALAIR